MLEKDKKFNLIYLGIAILLMIFFSIIMFIIKNNEKKENLNINRNIIEEKKVEKINANQNENNNLIKKYGKNISYKTDILPEPKYVSKETEDITGTYNLSEMEHLLQQLIDKYNLNMSSSISKQNIAVQNILNDKILTYVNNNYSLYYNLDIQILESFQDMNYANLPKNSENSILKKAKDVLNNKNLKIDDLYNSDLNIKLEDNNIAYFLNTNSEGKFTYYKQIYLPIDQKNEIKLTQKEAKEVILQKFNFKDKDIKSISIDKVIPNYLFMNYKVHSNEKIKSLNILRNAYIVYLNENIDINSIYIDATTGDIIGGYTNYDEQY